VKDLERLQPIDAATKFIEKHFPYCHGAILGGSVVRGEATKTSDLDIVVFDNSLTSSYRESLIDFGWAIEVFAHSLFSYKKYFASDYKRARPSLPRMVSEGITLKDTGIVESIKNEAHELLEKGPEKWTEETIYIKRYFITNALDDFIGSSNREEELFIANKLGEIVHEFVLRANGYWIGDSKWIVRSLKHYDENFSKKYVLAFDEFYKTGQKRKVVQLVHDVLEPYGGRLFDGFSLGKK
jgi:hypothetical protein